MMNENFEILGRGGSGGGASTCEIFQFSPEIYISIYHTKFHINRIINKVREPGIR